MHCSGCVRVSPCRRFPLAAHRRPTLLLHLFAFHKAVSSLAYTFQVAKCPLEQGQTKCAQRIAVDCAKAHSPARGARLAGWRHWLYSLPPGAVIGVSIRCNRCTDGLPQLARAHELTIWPAYTAQCCLINNAISIVGAKVFHYLVASARAHCRAHPFTHICLFCLLAPSWPVVAESDSAVSPIPPSRALTADPLNAVQSDRSIVNRCCTRSPSSHRHASFRCSTGPRVVCFLFFICLV